MVGLGGSRVGVAGEDLRVAKRHPGIQGVGDACRSECGLMCRGMPAALAILVTIRYASRRSIGWSEMGRSQPPAGPLTAAGLEDAWHRDCHWHRRGLVALADQAEDAVPA